MVTLPPGIPFTDQATPRFVGRSPPAPVRSRGLSESPGETGRGLLFTATNSRVSPARIWAVAGVIAIEENCDDGESSLPTPPQPETRDSAHRRARQPINSEEKLLAIL